MIIDVIYLVEKVKHTVVSNYIIHFLKTWHLILEAFIIETFILDPRLLFSTHLQDTVSSSSVLMVMY